MTTKLSRRSFMKASAVFGGTLALAGCKKTVPADVEQLSTPKAPEEMLSIATTAPHNCGGACALRAVVKNGTIRRILTDESKKDENLVDALYFGGKGKAVDAPQERACVRCHAQKAWSTMPTACFTR